MRRHRRCKSCGATWATREIEDDYYNEILAEAERHQEAGRRSGRARRGFDLPRHLEGEYAFLTRSKRMPAKEAAMMLGIPLDDESA